MVRTYFFTSLNEDRKYGVETLNDIINIIVKGKSGVINGFLEELSLTVDTVTMKGTLGPGAIVKDGRCTNNDSPFELSFEPLHMDEKRRDTIIVRTRTDLEYRDSFITVLTGVPVLSYEYPSDPVVNPLTDVVLYTVEFYKTSSDLTTATVIDKRESVFTTFEDVKAIDYDLLENVPATFPPSFHTHSDVAPIEHTHADNSLTSIDWSKIIGKPVFFPPSAHSHGGEYAPATHTHDGSELSDVAWSSLSGTPLAFPPTAHTHANVELLDIDWAKILNKPATFPPATHNHDSVYAPVTHGHTVASLSDYDWTTLPNKPASFPPSPHTHEPIDIDIDWTTLAGKPDTFPPSAHTHADAELTNIDWTKILNKPATFPPSVHDHNMVYSQLGHIHADAELTDIAWTKVTGKPATYPATAHTHADAELTNIDWAKILNKPVSFPPSAHDHDSAYAPLSHGHDALVDLTNYDWTSLPGKPTTFAPSAHTHEPIDLNISWTTLSGKPATFPPSTHSHADAELTNIDWTKILNKPASYTPSAHKTTHATGGTDVLTPADIGAAAAAHSHANAELTNIDWSKILNKPATYPATAHSHADAELTNIDWTKILNKPATFTPSAHNHDTVYAPLSHGHDALVDLTNYDWTSLPGKPTTFAPSAHTHANAELTDIDWSKILNKPASYTPSAHKTTHATGGTDVLTPSDIGAIPSSEKGAVNGVASLDASGKINTTQLPSLAITDTYEVATEAAMLALAAQKGDIAIRSDLNKTFILSVEPATTLANWKELKTPTDTVLSVDGQTGAVSLSGVYAPIAKGVTNGDTHDHSGGDGAQISHANLSNIGTNSHATIDTFVASKAAANGLASLNASSLVVQNPANAQTTAAASKIPISDGSGKLDSWISDASTTVKGKVQLAADGGTTAGQAVQANDARLSNARTPTTHSHGDADLTAIAWTKVTGKPTTFAPSAHKTSHASGGSDVLTPADIGAVATSDARLTDRRQVKISALTRGTGGTYINQWTKIARITLTAQFADTDLVLESLGSSSGDTVVEDGRLFIRVKQQNPFGSNPYIDVFATYMSKKSYNVGYVIVQNTPTTIVDIYVQNLVAYSYISFFELAKGMENDDVTYYSAQIYEVTVANLVEGSVFKNYHEGNLTSDIVPRKSIEITLTTLNWFTFLQTPVNCDEYHGKFKITVYSSTNATIGNTMFLTVMGRKHYTPTYMLDNHSNSSGANSGLDYIRALFPKTLNNGYRSAIDFHTYDATSRTIKIELLESYNLELISPVVTIYNSTYHNATQVNCPYSGIYSNKLAYVGTSGNAGSASQIYNNNYTAGEALVASDIIYLDDDNKWYKAGVAGRTIPSGTVIARCVSTYALNATVGCYVFGYNSMTVPAGTVNLHKDIYIQGTISGGVFTTTGVLTTELAAGYSYLRFGVAKAATVVYLDGRNVLYSVDSSGLVVSIDNIPLPGALVAAHAASHNVGGTDELLASDIGAEPAFTKNTAFNKNFGQSVGTVCQGNDSRLYDTRYPLYHAESHLPGNQEDALYARDLDGAETIRVGYSSAISAGEWIRIAASSVGIQYNTGIFTLRYFNGTTNVGLITFIASHHYGVTEGTSITILNSSGRAPTVSKLRLVYHTTATGNYVYLEALVAVAATYTFYPEVTNRSGWSTLYATKTAGGIPTGYVTYEITVPIGMSVDMMRVKTMSHSTGEVLVDASGNVWNAVGNDFADKLAWPHDNTEPGYVVSFVDGILKRTTKRNDPNVIGIVSDTYSFCAGRKTDDGLPISIGGFVLAYVDKSYKPGTPLTVTKRGILSKARKGEQVLATFMTDKLPDTWNKVPTNKRSLVKVWR